MTSTKTRQSNRKPGDALVGIGGALAVVFVALGILATASGGNAVLLGGTVPALMLVMIGYLKRIAVALEASR